LSGQVAHNSRVRSLIRFLPDCLRLFKRVIGDPRVRWYRKVPLVLLVGYLASPIDLIPDFIPVLGQLDDAVLVALALRSVVRSAGPELIRELWPGPDESLRAVLRLAGATAT
jgi:uncharacterized membrane protein YkvA (DUF1232 family)